MFIFLLCFWSLKNSPDPKFKVLISGSKEIMSSAISGQKIQKHKDKTK